MNNNKIYLYLTASLALLLPVSGRIAWGLYILLHFNLLVLFTTLLTHGIRRLKLEKFRPGIICVEIISLTVLYKQLLNILCPVAAITLSLALYFPAISSVILTILASAEFYHLKQDLSEKLKISFSISGFCLVIFILRDVLGYGTITLPSWQKILVINIPSVFKSISLFSFIATIPGCIILLALIVAAYEAYGKAKNLKNAAGEE